MIKNGFISRRLSELYAGKWRGTGNGFYICENSSKMVSLKPNSDPSQYPIFTLHEPGQEPVIITEKLELDNQPGDKYKAVKERRKPIYEALKTMPPLSNWPNKPHPYKDEDSDVLKYILALGAVDMKDARAIRDNSRKLNPPTLLFSKESGFWFGSDYNFNKTQTHDI
jgi:hypothetical protein